MNGPERIQVELSRQHRRAAQVVAGFLVLTAILLAIAYWASPIYRAADRSVSNAFWIPILLFGVGALVLRRARFATVRLKDIAAVKGTPALLKTLRDTTIQVALLGGAIALMGFIITILTSNWFDMLRAAGVAVIVLIYCYPIKSAWQRAVALLAPED